MSDSIKLTNSHTLCLKHIDHLRELVDFLTPYTQRIYLVGGCVRDMIWGYETYDYDVEVYDILPPLFEELMLQWGAVGVGKSFYVYRKEMIDISLPRTESKTSIGHSGFDVALTNDEQVASNRRDFTINALMLNVLTGEVLDFYGGVRDIRNKVLRVVNPLTFVEDSLRVLRAVRFVGRFGLKIEDATAKLCTEISLCDLSAQRVTQEFQRIDQNSFEKGMKTAFDLGVFDRLFGKKVSMDDLKLHTLITIACRSLEGCSSLSALIWLLKESYHPNFATIEKIFSLSRDEKKLAMYQKRVPCDVSDRFLAAMGEKFPLKQWVGGYDLSIQQRSKELGIWDHPLPPIDHHEAMVLGLKGGEIGLFCQQKRRERLRTFKGKQ